MTEDDELERALEARIATAVRDVTPSGDLCRRVQGIPDAPRSGLYHLLARLGRHPLVAIPLRWPRRLAR